MAALLLLGLAGFFLLALWSYTRVDFPGLKALWDAAAVHNSAGKAGVLVAALPPRAAGSGRLLGAPDAPGPGLAVPPRRAGGPGLAPNPLGPGGLAGLGGVVVPGVGRQYALRRRLPREFPGGHLASQPQYGRGRSGPGSGPAHQCHGGHPPVLRGAHGPPGPGAAGPPGAWGGGGKKSCRRRPRTTPGGQPSGARSSPRPGARRKSRS